MTIDRLKKRFKALNPQISSEQVDFTAYHDDKLSFDENISILKSAYPCYTWENVDFNEEHDRIYRSNTALLKKCKRKGRKWQKNFIMEPLTGKIRPVKFAVFDIEADHWTDFIGLGYYDGEEYKFYDSVKKFCDDIFVRSNAGKVIFAHAGSIFDFSFILRELERDDRGFTVNMSAGTTGIWNLKLIKKQYNADKDTDKTLYTITLSDSFRLLPQSLGKLGKGFDVADKKIELPLITTHTIKRGYHTFRNNMDEVSKFSNWRDYLKNDCLCLYECIEKFYEMVNAHGGNCKLTIASTSMDIFRRQYLGTSIKTCPSIESTIRKAYYGGRCEVFKLYGVDLHYYDFNSLYPWVMEKKAVPIGMHYLDRNIDAPGFSLVDVEIDDCDIPILPYRKDNKLLFPIGKFTGWYDNELLRYAANNGYGLHVVESVNFDKEGYIFKDFVHAWYKLKSDAEKEGNTAMRTLSKLVLNSLYGKFGQRREIEHLIMAREMEEGMSPYDEDHGLYLKGDISKACFILPWIASHITAMAGIELHKKMVQAEDVYYCDTDSIVTSTELDTGSRLGDLKLVHEIEKGYFLLPKVYAVLTSEGETFIKAKGFSRDLRQALSFNDIAKDGLACFKEKNESFLSLRESLRRHGEMVSKAIVKRAIKKEYSKRTVNPDMTTEPLRLG